MKRKSIILGYSKVNPKSKYKVQNEEFLKNLKKIENKYRRDIKPIDIGIWLVGLLAIATLIILSIKL